MRLLRILIYIVLLFIIAIVALGFYVDQQLEKKDYADSYNDCRKVWTARGLYGQGVSQNSIESIGAAFNEGAMGVEVDIFYDVKLKDYIVSHSYPYAKKNGRLLPLSELFEAIGDDHYFWLDFKKLRRLTREQALQAVQRLIDISTNNGLKDRIYVEGETPINLAHFRSAGFHTIFDTHAAPDNQFLSVLMVNVYKIFFYFGGHSVMGVEYGELDNPVFGINTRERLKNVPVFVYHLPVDEPLIDEMLKLENVRAFIIGNNQSINYHHKDNCSTP